MYLLRFFIETTSIIFAGESVAKNVVKMINFTEFEGIPNTTSRTTVDTGNANYKIAMSTISIAAFF